MAHTDAVAQHVVAKPVGRLERHEARTQLAMG